MKKKDNKRFTLGLVFLTIGFIILLNNLNLFDLGDFISTFWPLLLVIWGISYLIKSRDPDEKDLELIPVTSAGSYKEEPSAHKSKSNPNQIHKLIGDIVIRPEGGVLKSGSYSTLIGEIFIDLTKTELPKEPVRLYLNATIGSTRVMVNQALSYKITANALAGDINIMEIRDSGIQAKVNWENKKAGNLIEINLNTLFGDVIVW